MIRRRSPLALTILALLSTLPAGANAPPGRYTYPQAGTVLDTKTNLTWQQTVDSSLQTWAAAGTYCTGLGLAGGGWRLPTTRELVTIVDVTLSNPAIDPVAFPSTPAEGFWSSTACNSPSGDAWYVGFADGSIYFQPTSNTYRVRCVR